MSKLDDIEAAVDAAAQAASDDVTRMTSLVNEAITMLKDLQAGADPVHAAAIVAKINTIKDTVVTTMGHVLDSLDTALHPVPEA